MKYLIIIILASVLAIFCESCGPEGISRDEVQLAIMADEAFLDNLSVPDSVLAVERLKHAYCLDENYYQLHYYQKNGHLFFGFLSFKGANPKNGDGDGDTRRNWLTHDPDCPKCLQREWGKNE